MYPTTPYEETPKTSGESDDRPPQGSSQWSSIDEARRNPKILLSKGGQFWPVPLFIPRSEGSPHKCVENKGSLLRPASPRFGMRRRSIGFSARFPRTDLAGD